MPPRSPQSANLPPGYTLDAPTGDSGGGLPAGYTLDTPTSTTSTAPSVAAPKAQPSFMNVLTQPTDKTDKEYMGYTGPAGVAGATIHGLSNVAHGTLDAIKGAASMFDPRTQPGENAFTKLPVVRAAMPLISAAKQVPEIPQAIRDINASADPLSHYANAAQDTAAQGAGQALTAAASEGAMRGVPKIVDAAKAHFAPPVANLVDGVYSKPGSQVAASLRGSSRFDVPAAASNAHAAISEGLADRGITAADFKGRNGPAALQAGIDNAIDIHEARAKQIIDPIRGEEVDQQVIAQNPELAKQFTPEQLKKGITYGDIDAQRIALNKQLRRANFYSKDPSAQYAVADPMADAHAAADQARNLVYGKAEQTTGANLRPLKQTESNLIKLGDLAETTKNGLSAGAAQNETASPLAKGVNAVKKIIAVKKNPASSLASLANSPETLDLDGFNGNMRKAFGDVKAAPASVLKNGRLIEPGPGVLTSPRGTIPPELSRQLPLSLEPNKPGYELTPPAGKTPPEIQPRQSAIPLEHGYHDVPGQDLHLTPPPPGEVGPTPLQNLLDFSREAHPTSQAGVPKSLGAAAAQPVEASVPDVLKPALDGSGEIVWPDAYKNPPKGGGGNYGASELEALKQKMGIPERRAAARPELTSGADLEHKIKNRKPVITPFDMTEGASQTIKNDPNMPKYPNLMANGSGESAASAEALSRATAEKSAGTKRVVIDTRSGAERPLIGADAVDYRPKPYESVEFRGGKRDGEIIDQGGQARPYKRQ